MKTYLFMVTQEIAIKANSISEAHELLPSLPRITTEYCILEETIDLLKETE
mgnify:CR=1 FL=1